MFSRGKRLVQLSIEKETANALGNIKAVNTGISNSFSTESGLGNSQLPKESTLKEQVIPVDVNNNSEESEYDDDLRDPDYVPIKKKRKFTFESIVSGEFLKLDETVSDSSGSSSDSEIYETLMPTEVQDLNGVKAHSTLNATSAEQCHDEDLIPTKVVKHFSDIVHRSDTNANVNEQSSLQNVVIDTEYRNIVDTEKEVTCELTEHNIHEVSEPSANVLNTDYPNRIDHEEIVESNQSVPLRNKIESTKQVKKRNLKLREHGFKYVGQKKNEDGKKGYVVEKPDRILTKSNCGKKCRNYKEGRRCMDISGTERQAVFSKFWYTMSWSEKRVYVANLIERVQTSNNTTWRKYKYTYFLRIGENRLIVCKEMFLATLGIVEKMMYNWVEGSDEGIPSPKQGKRNNNLKHEEKEFAKQFLDSLPKVPSHYCRSSTSKKYIEPTFVNSTELYTEYRQKCQDESRQALGRTLFQDLFDSMNLSIYMPKKDLCDTCVGHTAGTVNDCNYDEHIRKKNSANHSKEEDKKQAKESHGKTIIITADLQSLLLCPKLNASCLYYKTKLSCHNYTVFDLVTHNADCYFWHEVDGELTANQFTSCLIDYLENNVLENTEKVIIYTDGCGYQNRNATLSNALSVFAKRKGVVIEHKYLERGHTHMECDSMHSVIERQIRNRNIYVPNDYIDIMKFARKTKPYKVKYLEYSFFSDFNAQNEIISIRPGIGIGSKTVNDLRVLLYSVDGSISFKTDYEDEFQELPVRKTKKPNLKDKPSQLYSGKLPVKRTKYNHLQEIKSVIPEDYHAFYDSLPVS